MIYLNSSITDEIASDWVLCILNCKPKLLTTFFFLPLPKLSAAPGNALGQMTFQSVLFWWHPSAGTAAPYRDSWPQWQDNTLCYRWHQTALSLAVLSVFFSSFLKVKVAVTGPAQTFLLPCLCSLLLCPKQRRIKQFSFLHSFPAMLPLCSLFFSPSTASVLGPVLFL